MLHRKTFFLVLVIVALTIVTASAESRYDVLTGGLGSVDLWSTATYDTGTGLWTYSYEMYNRPENVGDIHVFVVNNPPPSSYENATNDSAFSNPVWPTDVILQWLDGSVVKGAYGHFTYQSTAVPDIVPVDALVVDGGVAASGFTLGMGAAIPEPSCIASLAGLLGMTGFYMRRRRK